MGGNEKITFGATIVDAPQSTETTSQNLRSAPSKDTTLSTGSVDDKKQEDVDLSNPFSAFYKHPSARRSMDAPQSLDKKLLNAHDADLEAGPPLSAASTQQPKPSVDGRVKECTMWPSQQTMLNKKKANQRAKGCNMFRNLTSKQRLWVKIVIALVVIAAAVGLGVGISRAVGGGVWSGNGQSKQIPNN